MVFSLSSPLSDNFGTLDGDLGCFPFDHRHYAYRLSAILLFIGIQSLIRFSKSFGPPSLFSALPPIIIYDALPK